MRRAFLLAVLFGAALYTYGAFAELSFLSSAGRLGPGFFPRIIGSCLLVVSLYCLFLDIRDAPPEAESSAFWHVVILVGVLSGVFILLLNVLGGLLAMVVFLFASLSILNRGRLLQNTLVSLLLPLAVYGLFDVWLNASMPEGAVPLPV